jgi:hypothetical protein
MSSIRKDQSSSSDFSEMRSGKGYNSITQGHSILTARTKPQIESDYPEDKEELTLQSMRYCSRFETCSAPLCPLDILISERIDFEDNEKCGMAKATRHRYWESMPESLKRELPFEGYFSSEYHRIKSARERWESLSEERKAETRERMKRIRKGGVNVPP